ncbi:MAG: helix-turn-helix domain-containing protein [Okeania sp. SIO2D1]|nr:helix-turn-helix domain-containing protein [Okeania sp. SIO2D1]
MLILNYTYRIYPDEKQVELLNEWLETCRVAYNYALRELKDWIASRNCPIDRCSLESEYIMSADYPFPGYQQQQNKLPQAKKEFPRLKVEKQHNHIGFKRKDHKGTSQTCPNCRIEVRKELSERWHSCPECKYEVDRDVASAQEICNRGYEMLSTQGLWGKEIGCQVGLSGAFYLDKWRRAAMSNSDVGSPRCTS